jgi:hypothetical protein
MESWLQNKKSTKILLFSGTIPDKNYFFYLTILQGNPLHFILHLPIDLFSTGNTQFAIDKS